MVMYELTDLGRRLVAAVVGEPVPAAALLVGLLGNALMGAWWLDPLVGLLVAGVAVKESRNAWRGEGCCVSSPLDGARCSGDSEWLAACRDATSPVTTRADARRR